MCHLRALSKHAHFLTGRFRFETHRRTIEALRLHAPGVPVTNAEVLLLRRTSRRSAPPRFSVGRRCSTMSTGDCQLVESWEVVSKDDVQCHQPPNQGTLHGVSRGELVWKKFKRVMAQLASKKRWDHAG